MSDHSKVWITFNYTCVAVAYVMLSLSLVLMEVNLSTKSYVAMGIIFLSGSLVTLVKTLHDKRISTDVNVKLEKAKQEKLLGEYIAQT